MLQKVAEKDRRRSLHKPQLHAAMRGDRQQENKSLKDVFATLYHLSERNREQVFGSCKGLFLTSSRVSLGNDGDI
jgi:hypothetical protein